MKKFNSILAIATVAITSVLGFTSCQQDDPWSETQSQAPVQLTQNSNAGSNTNADSNTNTNTDTSNSIDTYKKNAQNGNYGYSLFVGDSVLLCGDYIVTVDLNGQKTEYKASEGQTTSKTLRKQTYQGKQLTVPAFTAADNAVITVKFVANDAFLASLDAEGRTTLPVYWEITDKTATGQIQLHAQDGSFYGMKNCKVGEVLSVRNLGHTYAK